MATLVLGIDFTCRFHSELLNSLEKHMKICEQGAEGQILIKSLDSANVGFVDEQKRSTHVLGM